jgi:uncharacterized membrane protein
MKIIRRSGSQLALLILALLGVADAVYLTVVHYNDQVTLVCPSAGFISCTNVITSKYSYVPGTTIPVSIPGLGWCLVIIALSLVGLYLGAERRWLRLAEFVWTLLGMLTILYLIYAEIVQIRQICLWCTFLHVLIFFMFLIALGRLPKSGSAEGG